MTDATAVTTISTLISTIGFPIVACGAVAWFAYKQSQKNDEKNNQFIDAINKNTIAITKLTDKMEVKA